MDSTPLTRRRWFQFGLGTMLLMMALCACFAIWLRNYSIIYQRRMARQRATTVLLASDNIIVIGGGERPRIPAWRTMLGDEAVTQMWLKDDVSDEEAARTIALFPEAEIRCPPFWTKVVP